MAGLAMAFDIIARDHASKTFKDVGESAGKAGKKVGEVGAQGEKSGSLLSKGMKVAGVGMLAAAGAAVAFGKESIDAFEGNTKAAMGMQRAIGGSIEDASRLNFAAKESGVSQDALSKSLKLLEKNIATVAGKAGPGAKALASMGIQAKDAHGNMKPMAQLLPDIADKFAKMPNGAEKSALAMKLFGRGGLEMLPMLNKGKVGIDELMKESDKFGLTVGQSQVDAVKKNIVAHRQWHAAMEGLKVQIGSQLLPILTALFMTLMQKLMPAILGATKFLMDNKDTIANLTGVLIRFLPQIAIGIGLIKGLSLAVKGMTIAQQLFNLVLKDNPIGIVITLIAALAAGLIYAYQHSATFRNIVNGAFTAIGNAARWMWNNMIQPVIQFMVKGFATVIRWVGNLFDLLSHVPGFGWAADLRDKCYKAAAGADSLAASIKKIPTTHNTTITANTAPALAKLSAMASQWAHKTFTITAKVQGVGTVLSNGGAYGGLTGGGAGGGFLDPFGSVRPGFPWGHYPSGGIHRALDFPVPIGTPVHAGEAGTVMVAGWDTTGFGNVVRTHDADGNYTIYGHNSRLNVQPGQHINAGALLAWSGSTGNSTGPHAHVERRHILYDPSTAFNFTNQLRFYANGGQNIPQGWAIVGERGPELAFMPHGSTVLPEDRTRGVLNQVRQTPKQGDIRLAPEDLAALERAVYAGTLAGAQEGAYDGTHAGAYAGTSEGAADGIARATAGVRRSARAVTGAARS